MLFALLGHSSGQCNSLLVTQCMGRPRVARGFGELVVAVLPQERLRHGVVVSGEDRNVAGVQWFPLLTLPTALLTGWLTYTPELLDAASDTADGCEACHSFLIRRSASHTSMAGID